MPEREESSDWQAAWQAVIDQVGNELGDGSVAWGADVIEAGTVRRYLEPLEFDCSLHHDAESARAHGYADIVAPYTALLAFAFPPVWEPGEAQFTDGSRNAQPARLSVQPVPPEGAPAVSGFFVSDWSSEYLRPVLLGDRVGRRGMRLISCVPKETKVGRGAFVTFESDLVDSQERPVMRNRRTIYFYNPHPT